MIFFSLCTLKSSFACNRANVLSFGITSLELAHGLARFSKLTERIRKALEKCGDNPPDHVKKYVLEECRRWNLVWVGKSKVATLEPDEVEMLLGFPINHTRGGGLSRTDIFKSLGNSFQVRNYYFICSIHFFPSSCLYIYLFIPEQKTKVLLNFMGQQANHKLNIEIFLRNV